MIDRELAKTVERILRDGDRGSLFLGKGRGVRQIVFVDGGLRLIDAGEQIRFCPTPALLDSERLEPNRLDFLLSKSVAQPKSLATVEEVVALLDEQELEELSFEEYCQECLMLLEEANGHWVFENDTVPAKEKKDRTLATDRFHGEFKRRLGEIQLIEKLFPSEDELPVLSAQGIAARSVPEHWLFSRVADLVDGFRTVRRLRKDCPFPPHLTVKILAAAARQGWILKKRFPELKEIVIGDLDHEQLIPFARTLEAATQMAVDPVPLLRKLVEIHQLLEDPAAIAQQWIRIGDVLAARRNNESALASYREALRIVPGHPGATERSAHLLEEQAEEALASGDDVKARTLLREGLPMRGSDEVRTLRILETFDDERELAREATRIASRLHQQQENEGAIRLLDLAVAHFPGNESLIRTRINFLIDHGEEKRAVVELRKLATRLRVERRIALARSIEEKIARVEGKVALAPEPDEIDAKPAIKPPPPAASNRKRILIPLTIIALLLALLVVVHDKNQQLVARAEALLATPRGEPGTPQLKAWDSHARRWLIDGHHLKSWLPRGPWRSDLDRVSEYLEREVKRVIERTQETLGDLAKEADSARLAGKTGEVERILTRIEIIGQDSSWQRWAAKRRQKWQEYESEADLLARQARQHRESGDLQGAFSLLKQLVDRYPSSASASGITLPVELRSEGREVEIYRGGKSLGRTPLWIEVRPLETIHIEARSTDGSRQQLEISVPEDPIFLFDSAVGK